MNTNYICFCLHTLQGHKDVHLKLLNAPLHPPPPASRETEAVRCFAAVAGQRAANSCGLSQGKQPPAASVKPQYSGGENVSNSEATGWKTQNNQLKKKKPRQYSHTQLQTPYFYPSNLFKSEQASDPLHRLKY